LRPAFLVGKVMGTARIHGGNMGIGKAILFAGDCVATLAWGLAVTIVTTGCVFALDDAKTPYKDTTATVVSKHTETEDWEGHKATWAWILDVKVPGGASRIGVDGILYDRTPVGSTLPVSSGKGPLLGITRVMLRTPTRPADQYW
jgi:hypothetical protein